ncbi:hypothetical protein HYU94_02575 [Candidatus Daviesbacteria bacterium]|nr:hypothetical protein [Candidatus Daviesbacteria bacterium]
MKKKKFNFPDFNKMSYEEEANWWDTHDWGEFWDELKDVDIVFELHKPKDETIIVRMQKSLKAKLARIAKAKGLNMSSLARLWLVEKLQSSRS